LNESTGSLSQNPVVIAFLLKIAFYSQKINPLYLHSGESKWISFQLATTKESPVRVRNSSLEYIPEQRRQGNRVVIAPGKQNPKAGIYEVLQEESVLGYFAVNNTAAESYPELFSIEEIKQILEAPDLKNFNIINFENRVQLMSSISKMNLGTPLWKIFLLLTLFFVLLEILLIRFFKV
jgi:hypothetical protein